MVQTDSADEVVKIRPSYEAFVVSLIALSLVNSFLALLVQNREQRTVIFTVQALICVFLLVDAFYRLIRAPSKRRFLSRPYNWLYFVGSLPIPFICAVRLVPTWIMVRRLKLADYEALGRGALRRRAQSTLLSVILVTILVLEFGSIAVLGAEWQASNSNIKTAQDALWWAVVTVATVGYGDRYPTTLGGRVTGVFMMVVGVAVFAALSSFLAQWFLRQRSAPENDLAAPVGAQFDSEGSKQHARDTTTPVTWEQIRALLDERETAHRHEVRELRARLSAFESAQQPGLRQPSGGGADAAISENG
jgi:voltage-gated potassium channel Kch